MNDQILEFEPSTTLYFDRRKGESQSGSSTVLRITNVNRQLTVLYRVQTTTPTAYRVRPSHGRIPPGEHADVQIVMMSESERSDKFQVKYVTLDADVPAADFITQFKEASGTMKEHRFRVAIASPSASSVVETSSVVASSPAKSEEIRDHSSLRGSTSSIAREPSSMSHDSLVTELSEARAKIQTLLARNQELSQQVEESKNVRRRGTPEDSEAHPTTKLARGITDNALSSMLAAQNGFPPILVILIAIFSFLLGLLF